MSARVRSPWVRRAAGRRALLALPAAALMVGLLAAGALRAGLQPPDDPLAGGPSDARTRSAGEVVDRAGAPVEGAAVRLLRGGVAEAAVSTDRRGRWTTPPLAPGRYEIVVEKDGYLPSDGFVVLAAEPLAPTLRVELRSLDEATPAFAEGDVEASLRGWLSKANELLEQGRHPAAREEYGKALRHLAGERRAEVLRAVARTHYLEGDVEASLDVLVEALRAAPGVEDTRALYLALMEQLGRREEAERRLGEVEAEAAAASGSEPPTAPGVSRPAPPAPVPVDAAADAVGALTVRFSERSPLSTSERVLGHYGLRPEDVVADDHDPLGYRIEDESFDLLVPESYRSDSPWGLVVWISPISRGGVRSSEVAELLERRRLLWVGANDAGNPRPKWERIALALDAAHNVARLYSVDPSRVVVGGYSGGGRVAMAAGTFFPEVFRGVVCWFGAEHFRPVPVPYKPGHSWPAAFPAPPRRVLAELESKGRYALVTGELDFNRSETAAVHRAMREDGFERVVYLEIPGADHYHGLDPEWLGRALEVVAP